MVSNRRPKSNFSNAKVIPNKFTDITLEQANEMLAENPKVFMIQNQGEVNFSPIVKGQQIIQQKPAQYRLVLSNEGTTQ